MKLQLVVGRARYDEIKKELTEKGIQIDQTADLILMEHGAYMETILGKSEDELTSIPVNELIYIESFGHDILLHTMDHVYKVNERLYQLEEKLNPKDFMRISNSVMIATKKIKSLKPTLSAKFILTMMDGSKVDVTRSYYYMFKERFGI